MIKHVFLAVFAAATLVHLIFTWRKDIKGRRWTKPLLIISLLVYYLCVSAAPSKLLVAALICSWIGDILLMWPGDLWLTLGGAFFIGAHVFLMVRFALMTASSDHPWLLIAPIACAFVVFSWLTYRKIKDKISLFLKIVMFMYLIINSAMNIFAFMHLWSEWSAGALLASVGALMFFISDCVLYLVMYTDNTLLVSNFTVMITYLLAESLIVAGDLIH